MDIVIVGSGKVGFSLAEQLVREEHNVTIIDNDEEALHRAGDQLDVMTVRGNPAGGRRGKRRSSCGRHQLR